MGGKKGRGGLVNEDSLLERVITAAEERQLSYAYDQRDFGRNPYLSASAVIRILERAV